MIGKAISLRSLLAIAIGIFMASATLVQAQLDTGTIVGRVTDASGAVIGGAKVTLTNQGTGAALSTTTGADGTYHYTPVRIGAYKLDASAPGFQTVSQTELVYQVNAKV